MRKTLTGKVANQGNGGGRLSSQAMKKRLRERLAAKAVRVMQQEFASDLARSVAAHVYGEMDLPVSDSVPSGCPGEAAQPQATH